MIPPQCSRVKSTAVSRQSDVGFTGICVEDHEDLDNWSLKWLSGGDGRVNDSRAVQLLEVPSADGRCEIFGEVSRGKSRGYR